MQAMVLAAGLGTRLGPVSSHIPKPLFPVLNVPNLLRILVRLREAGCHKVIVNAFHLASQIQDAVAAWACGMPVTVLVERELLGTGGGIRNALSYFDPNEPILLVNGDVVTDMDLGELVRRHLESGADATMALHQRVPWNRVSVKGDRVTGFGTDLPNAVAYTGIAVLEPRIVAAIPPGPGSIIDAFTWAIQKGSGVAYYRIDQDHGHQTHRRYIWEDIGSPSGYLAAHEAILSTAGNGLYAEPSADIPPDLVCRDWAVVGARVSIGPGVTLEQTVIWDGCSIPAGTHLKRTVITPYGHLSA
ncbi:MAG: NDP-sugar synthase [Deltaproteobacteria bacterium]